MDFEFRTFPGKGRGYSARASIRKSGQIGFNTGAVMHHDLERYDGAILHHDVKNAVIGFELTTGSSDAKVCGLIHRPGNSYIAAKSFFDWAQIPLGDETTRYDLWKDEKTGLLIIELTKPLVKSGNRSELAQESAEM